MLGESGRWWTNYRGTVGQMPGPGPSAFPSLGEFILGERSRAGRGRGERERIQRGAQTAMVGWLEGSAGPLRLEAYQTSMERRSPTRNLLERLPAPWAMSTIRPYREARKGTLMRTKVNERSQSDGHPAEPIPSCTGLSLPDSWSTGRQALWYCTVRKSWFRVLHGVLSCAGIAEYSTMSGTACSSHLSPHPPRFQVAGFQHKCWRSSHWDSA